MNLLKKSLIIVFFIIISGCGNHEKTNTIYVSSLTKNVQKQVDQNLLNGVIPSPHDISSENMTIVTDACNNFKTKTIPSNWFQDTIEVPEDPTLPDGPKIKVFYYGQIREGSIPTVYFNGGPLSDSHGSFTTMTSAQNFFDSNKKISFIFIDQRGNGCSDFYPQGNSEVTLQKLRNYGSTGIVYDAEVIRKKILGNKEWNIYGHSYGAFIAHRYTILFPHSIHATFAHANTINSNGFDRIKNRIQSQIRIMNSYLGQFPDDEARLKLLKDYLVLDKCYTSEKDVRQKACGNRPLELISSKLLGFSNQWIKIHQWLGLMVEGEKVNEDGIKKFLATFYFGESNPLNSTSIAGKVIDWVDRGLPEMDTFTCRKIKDELLKVGIDLMLSYSNECMKSLQVNSSTEVQDSSIPYQKLKQDLMSIDQLVFALKSNPSLPFYLYSGKKDGYVPIENFSEEVTKLNGISNVFYRNFEDTGHDEYVIEPISWKDLLLESLAN